MKSNQLISFSTVNWKQYLPETIDKTNMEHGKYLPQNSEHALILSHVKYVFGNTMPDMFYIYIEKKIEKQIRDDNKEVEEFDMLKKALSQTKLESIIEPLLIYVSKLTCSQSAGVFEGNFPSEPEFREDLKIFYEHYYVSELCPS